MKVLAGVRVLELGSFLTAPFCGMMLADLGADVVKIEPPEGDPFRTWQGGKYSPHFVSYNKNKRSVTLDLKSDEGRTDLLTLVDQADVLLENFRPGVMERMGLSWSELHAHNSRLIHCSITGFGNAGPYRSRPAYDSVIGALSGFLALSLEPDEPVLVGATVADNVGGMTACYAILAALYEREHSNVGRRVEVNMLEALVSFAQPDVNSYVRSGKIAGRFSRVAASQCWSLSCADESVLVLHISTPEKFWLAAVAALERPELAHDPRFNTLGKRVENYLELTEVLRGIVHAQPISYWIPRLEEYEVPHAPVNRTDEVLADPQLQALGTFARTTHPTEGELLLARRPVYFDGQRPTDDVAPPTLGEHTAQVLGSAEAWPAPLTMSH